MTQLALNEEEAITSHTRKQEARAGVASEWMTQSLTMAADCSSFSSPPAVPSRSFGCVRGRHGSYQVVSVSHQLSRDTAPAMECKPLQSASQGQSCPQLGPSPSQRRPPVCDAGHPDPPCSWEGSPNRQKLWLLVGGSSSLVGARANCSCFFLCSSWRRREKRAKDKQESVSQESASQSLKGRTWCPSWIWDSEWHTGMCLLQSLSSGL